MHMRKWLTPGNILYVVLLLAPFIAGAVLYTSMPEQVPVHWNVQNEPDGYAGRPFALFGLPAIMLLISAAVLFITGHDPKRDNLKRSKGVMAIIRWFLALLPIFVQALVIGGTLLPDGLDIGLICMLGMGLLFAVLGNYLPKCQPNYTVGIRLPWTLASEDNWRKTHRLGGYVWVIGGLCMAVLAWTPWRYLDIIPLLGMVLIPAVYSFLLYRREKKNASS